MVDSPTFRMADALTDGQLASILREERSAGKSLNRISRRLFADFGVEVTAQTVGNWCDGLGIDKEPASS